MKVSVVIPAFNEDGNIGPLIEEVLSDVPTELLGEVIVVDDCSSDGTGDAVHARREMSQLVRHLRHETNAGQSAALRTGVAAARFDVIATLDGDGQNVPGDIASLVAMLDPASGPHLVGGVRRKRRDTLSKRLASKSANFIRRSVLRDDCPDTGCGIKVFSRDVFMRLPFFSGLHRYLPALFAANGYTCAYAPVQDRPRRSGVSKYTNFGRAIIGIYDLVGVGWLIRRSRNPAVREMGND